MKDFASSISHPTQRYANLMGHQPRRRWLQYSLRSLLLVTTMFSIGLGVANRVRHLRHHAEFHRAEASRLGQQEWMTLMGGMESAELVEVSRQRRHHEALTAAFEQASHRPWMFIDESDSAYTNNQP